jgi:hypothetical protein
MTVILKKSNNAHWRVPQDLAIDLRASALADRVAAEVLRIHKASIIAGVRADDGTAQPPLDPKGQQGRKAAQGRRPPHRGNTGNAQGFPRTLRRGKTKKARGETNVSVTIEADPRLGPWLGREDDKRDVQYLFTTGEVADAIERVTFEWLDEVTRPGPKKKR